jgi:nitroimidazol reductase NimA-like FMN-containing flavoprotein (pyridoxamine 5'-phosphate oxidase superfamily)
MATTRIFKAPAGGGSMTRKQLEEFLGGKLILRLATVNRNGDPEIQPIWYHYLNGNLYLMTSHDSRKMQNIRRNNKVYFCVDTEIYPYKGAKGKGAATTVTDRQRAVDIAEKIGVKYLGDAENPMAKRFTNAVREGRDIVIEIVPDFFSVWDYSNLKLA